MNVLVFAPHPDDDLIGCGGSIIKHVEKGNDLTIVYMASGESGSKEIPKDELGEIRELEAYKAMKSLGVYDLIFLRQPDGYLQNNTDNLINVTNIIRNKKPHLVYLPHCAEDHPDHKATNKIVRTSIGRAAGPWFQECQGEPWNVDTILAYEVWTPLQYISYVEDISRVIDKKISALLKHNSQIQDIPYDKAVKGLNQYRGVMSGKGEFCEVFNVLKVSTIF